MRKPFDGSYRVSQLFGANPAMYARFNYKGHNGIDWAMPVGCTILSPHDGTVIEARDDKDGYGLYVKVENSKEGSVLAHFSKLDVVAGQKVSEGQRLGLSGNTGFSTGPHLHWGYYLMPRDRSNGYGGFIDQSPYIGMSGSNEGYYKGYNLSDADSMKVAVDVLVRLQTGELVGKEDLAKITKELADLKKSYKSLAERVVELEGSIKSNEEIIVNSTRETGVLRKTIQKIEVENRDLLESIEYYKPYKSRYEKALETQVDKYQGIDLIVLGIKKIINK